MTIDMRTKAERVAAITANALSPVRTPAAVYALSEVELTNLETHLRNLEGKDPYARVNKAVPRRAQATDDPNYDPNDPYGAAPSSYRIALASRGVEMREPPAPVPAAPVVRAASTDVYANPPDSYAIALGKEHAR
jgi:hypothetical protein